MKVNEKGDSIKTENIFKFLKDGVVLLGTGGIYVVFAYVLILVNEKYGTPINREATDSIWTLIWNSFFSVVSGVSLVIELVIATILIYNKKHVSKIKVISIFVLTYILVIFNDVAIKYPFSQAMICIVNFIVIIIFVVMFLLNNGAPLCAENINEKRKTIHRLLGNTSNKKIIAVQMYKVKESHYKDGSTEKVRYDIQCKESFVRETKDINSILSMTYDLEKSVVESFNVIIQSYHSFIQTGNEQTKKSLIDAIVKEKECLSNRLKCIQSPDAVTKEDCCLARILVIYLSFLHILDPEPNSTDIPGDYVGEVSLSDGALNLLDIEIEKKLFTYVRTGVLGAILLGDTSRHVFSYKKDGVKQGRKYCATQVYVRNENLVMDICLFTVEEEKYNIIPSYIIKSINSIENQLKKELHNLYGGGELNE